MSGTLQVGGLTLGTHNSGTGKVDITNAGTADIANATITAGTIGSSVVFPAGHVVQTVHQQYNQSTIQTSYATVPTHMETEINITAGNKVFFNYSIPTRLFASGYAYGQFKYYLYHKTTSGGTYAEAYTGLAQANHYFDQAGNMPTDFYRYAVVTLTGIHTPSSGTQQFYKIYVQLIQGNDVHAGLGNIDTTFITLMEIQS